MTGYDVFQQTITDFLPYTLFITSLHYIMTTLVHNFTLFFVHSFFLSTTFLHFLILCKILCEPNTVAILILRYAAVVRAHLHSIITVVLDLQLYYNSIPGFPILQFIVAPYLCFCMYVTGVLYEYFRTIYY